jgi:hypothetical protein
VRFMMIRRADKQTEAGVLPGPEMLAAMTKYNQDMAAAGVFIEGVGLRDTSKAARVKITGGTPIVTDGPFTETKELIAGFTLIRANSLAEAIEWVKKWPALDEGAEIEVRQLFEPDDFQTK